MPRPQKRRIVSSEPEYSAFNPEGFSSGEEIVLSLDEYEVIRLVDYERKTHEETGLMMGISRTTVTEIYDRARYRLASAIVNGRALAIRGGSYEIGLRDKEFEKIMKEKGEKEMRVAVTYEDGMIFQHFGHTEFFKIYDIEEGKITASQVVSTNGNGHGALAGFLAENNVDVLICGGIGGGAQMALMHAGIQLFGGVSGDANEAVNNLLNGILAYDPNARCTHHDHSGHDCSHHHHGDGHSCSHHHGDGHKCNCH